MINRIILKDSCSDDFNDIITFKHNVFYSDIIKVVSELQDEKPDYTNEDVYGKLDEVFGIKSIDYIGQLDIVEY